VWWIFQTLSQMLCPKKELWDKIFDMKRNWEKYNRELVRRGEILINPETIGVSQKMEKSVEDLTFILTS